MTKKIRVRIAPSPTGFLHVGTARTALYNYLWAKKHNGTFVLRIEDTDKKRSTKEMVDIIIDSLNWLNLKWDEGPFYQSDRFDTYKEYADKLVHEGKAYYCYCTPEEIAQRKEKVIKEKKAWKYDRRCLHLSEEEKEQFEKEGRLKAIRFLVPEGETVFNDLVHGEIKREHSQIEDFVIMKSDGSATYNLAVVADDHHMNITHVIRGDDHISNTFKQILLYKALGWDIPKFAHLPLILAPDKSKLSKRHGAIAVTEYREMGYLPEAFVNFLALLGWSPGDNQEKLPIEELIKRFDLKDISKRGAVFDTKKLLWMNAEYIKNMDDRELYEKVKPLWEKADYSVPFDNTEYILKAINLLKERSRLLPDFVNSGKYFFTDEFEYEEKGIKKHFLKDKDGTIERIRMLIEDLNKLNTEDWTEENLENVYRKISEEKEIKAGLLIHPTRLAITGLTVGPSLFILMEVLGKDKVLQRLTKALNFVINAS